MYTLQLICFIYFALVFIDCCFLDDGYRDYMIDIFFPIKMIVKFIKWIIRKPVDSIDHENFPL